MKFVYFLIFLFGLLKIEVVLAESTEEIPWGLNPGEEQPKVVKETPDKKKPEEQPIQNQEIRIKINKDYPSSYFYPGPRREKNIEQLPKRRQ